jgi:hypothetical protein
MKKKSILLNKDKILSEKKIKTLEEKDRLEEIIPEFYQGNKSKHEESFEFSGKKFEYDLDDDSESEEDAYLNETEKKELFERLKTKTKFSNKEASKLIINKSENLFSNEILKHSQSLDRIRNISFIKNIPTNSQLFSTEINLKNYSLALGDTIDNNISQFSPRRMHNFKKNVIMCNSPQSESKIDKNISLVDSNPVIQNIIKMRKKMSIIDNMYQSKKESKIKMLACDLFSYNKKKWEKQSLKENEKVLLNIKGFESRRDEMLKNMQQIAKDVEKSKKAYNISHNEYVPTVESEEIV